MAIYRVQAPDGSILKIEGPDDATPAEVEAFAAQQHAATAEPPPKVPKVGDINPIIGGAEAGASLLSGTVAAPIAGLAGLVRSALPGKEGAGAETVNALQRMLTYHPESETGNRLLDIASWLPEKLMEGAKRGGEKVQEGGATPFGATGVETALSAIPMILGRAKGIPESAAAMAEREALRTANAPKATAVTKAQEAGYILPPAQANPGVLNSTIEWLAGNMNPRAQKANTEALGAAARRDLGLAPDAPLNADTLRALRKEAGKAYEDVKKTGVVTADGEYFAALDSIASASDSAAKAFPKAAKAEVKELTDSMREVKFDARGAVDKIGELREQADKAYRAGDKALGKATKDVAGALEEQLGRHLEAIQAPGELLDAFRSARQRIATSYTVQKALKGENIDGTVLAAELKKERPLSGELRTAAEVASEFPQAMKPPADRSLFGKMGITDAMLATIFKDLGTGGAAAGGAALMGGGMLPLALLGARPAMRFGMMSGPGQRLFAGSPGFQRNALLSMADKGSRLQANPMLPLAEMTAGQQ